MKLACTGVTHFENKCVVWPKVHIFAHFPDTGIELIVHESWWIDGREQVIQQSEEHGLQKEW